MRPLQSHPCLEIRARAEPSAALPHPASPALISRPQTLLQAGKKAISGHVCGARLQQLPRAIPGKAGSRGYNLWGKALRPFQLHSPPRAHPLCISAILKAYRVILTTLSPT